MHRSARHYHNAMINRMRSRLKDYVLRLERINAIIRRLTAAGECTQATLALAANASGPTIKTYMDGLIDAGVARITQRRETTGAILGYALTGDVEAMGAYLTKLAEQIDTFQIPAPLPPVNPDAFLTRPHYRPQGEAPRRVGAKQWDVMAAFYGMQNDQRAAA